MTGKKVPKVCAITFCLIVQRVPAVGSHQLPSDSQQPKPRDPTVRAATQQIFRDGSHRLPARIVSCYVNGLVCK